MHLEPEEGLNVQFALAIGAKEVFGECLKMRIVIEL